MSAFKGILYAKALAELHSLCFSAPWTLENFTKILALPTTFGFGDEKGFILCADLIEDIEILTLAVHPKYRRQGMASALLDEVKQLVQQQNKKHIFLEVNATNTPAKQLYLKNGFQQIGYRKNYYHENGQTSDALCLSWTHSQ